LAECSSAPDRNAFQHPVSAIWIGLTHAKGPKRSAVKAVGGHNVGHRRQRPLSAAKKPRFAAASSGPFIGQGW